MLLPSNSASKQTQRLLVVGGGGGSSSSSGSSIIAPSILATNNNSNTNSNSTGQYRTTNILPQSYDPYPRNNNKNNTSSTSTNRLPRTYGPQYNNSQHNRQHSSSSSRPKPLLILCVAVAVVGFVLAISVFTSGGDHHNRHNNPNQPFPFGKPDPNVQLPVNITQVDVLYSTALPVVGSKAIEDMLVAHAVAYNEKKLFGGACADGADGGGSNIAPDVQAQNEALIAALGLQSELFYACPKVNETDNNKLSSIVLTSSQYEYLSWRDTELMSPAWIKLLQKKINYPNKNRNQKKRVSIVAHVQRGAITPCITEYVRYLPNLHFQLLIQQYYQKGKTDVTILSQSPSLESFHNFTASGYQVHLNQTIVEDWLEMISADVLIMSRSSYSLVPAIFNKNTVVYTHYWHEPLPQWKIAPVEITKQSGAMVVQLRAKHCHNTTMGFNLQQQAENGDDDAGANGGVQQGV